MKPRVLFRSIVMAGALSVAGVTLVDAATPDLNGAWHIDLKRSDTPQRPGGFHGGGGPGAGHGGMSGGWGGPPPGGGGGGEHHRGGGPGGGPPGRPPRLPDDMHVTQTGSLVSFEDSTGAVVQEVATVAAAADTFARAPGASHLLGRWDGDKLVVERPGPDDSKITQKFSLTDKGKTLVIETKVPARGEMPARSFKRVYTRVAVG